MTNKSKYKNNKDIDFSTYIGCIVIKKSKLPFKSGSIYARVKGITINSYSGNEGFSFYEDDSIVDCFRCKLVPQYLDSDITLFEKYQSSGCFHPYTCGNCINEPLVMNHFKVYCKKCNFFQKNKVVFPSNMEEMIDNDPISNLFKKGVSNEQ